MQRNGLWYASTQLEEEDAPQHISIQKVSSRYNCIISRYPLQLIWINLLPCRTYSTYHFCENIPVPMSFQREVPEVNIDIWVSFKLRYKLKNWAVYYVYYTTWFSLYYHIAWMSKHYTGPQKQIVSLKPFSLIIKYPSSKLDVHTLLNGNHICLQGLFQHVKHSTQQPSANYEFKAMLDLEEQKNKTASKLFFQWRNVFTQLSKCKMETNVYVRNKSCVIWLLLYLGVCL